AILGQIGVAADRLIWVVLPEHRQRITTSLDLFQAFLERAWQDDLAVAVDVAEHRAVSGESTVVFNVFGLERKVFALQNAGIILAVHGLCPCYRPGRASRAERILQFGQY